MTEELARKYYYFQSHDRLQIEQDASMKQITHTKIYDGSENAIFLKICREKEWKVNSIGITLCMNCTWTVNSPFLSSAFIYALQSQ